MSSYHSMLPNVKLWTPSGLYANQSESTIHAFRPGQYVNAVLHTAERPRRQNPAEISAESQMAPLPLRLSTFLPGRETEDPDAGSQRGELPVAGEQDEAHDPHAGAGEGGSPEDHRTHALQPSA